ncbi:MAG TPA: ABC transporter permease, partial [Acidimicrobiales bacterium]|nr:ABC transporter permease [Acidimicrobiales bacterium]
RGTWQLAWARFRRDRAALIALAFIVLMILCAVFAPVFASLTGHGVNQQFRTSGLSPSGLPVSPNGTFLLGTDDQGRDILVRIMYGARISLFIGIVVTLITVAVGAILGLAAGYLGGIVDTAIARLIDVVLSLPYLMFAISLVSIGFLGGPGMPIIIFVIAVFSWAAVARVIRGQVLSIREKEYIEAARSLGAGSWRIMFVDILPNVVAQLIVYASLLIPVVIVFEAALSFLGLGIPPPTADWGQMIAESEGTYQQAWWFLVFPSLALVLTTLAFNIFGDGVRDALDPRLDRL